MKCLTVLSVFALSACINVPVLAPQGLPPTELTPTIQIAAEQAVAYRLKDPSSAQFRDLRAYRMPTGLLVVCGEINGKNSFGGYTGFSLFAATVQEAQPSATTAFIADPDDIGRAVFLRAYPVCS